MAMLPPPVPVVSTVPSMLTPIVTVEVDVLASPVIRMASAVALLVLTTALVSTVTP